MARFGLITDMNEPFPHRSHTVPSGAQLLALGSPRVMVGGVDLGAAAAQPKRLALLAYLVVAESAGFHRRDRLVALLWPDLDQEHARTALRKALHALRAALGAEAIRARGTEAVAIAVDRVHSDVLEFERAISENRMADALGWYRGDLLDGFFVSDAPAFERWLEHERARLRDRAAAAAWSVSAEREAAGDALAALRLARRAVVLSPDDETAVRRLIALLDRLGDRAGAVHTYAEFSKQLAEDFAVEPSAETQALIEAVRQRVARFSGTDNLPPVPPPHPLPSIPGPLPPRRASRLPLLASATVVLLAAGVWSAAHLWAGRPLPVTTRSRIAYQRYLEGTTAYTRGDFPEAQAAFEGALKEDSTFAMAAYYAALSAGARDDDPTYARYFADALQFARRASERERLLIEASWAERVGNPNALALAESLAARHADEPAGHDLLGRALLAGGDFLGAVPHLQLVAQADSQSLRPDAKGPCRACDALLFVAYAYWMADSLSAAERVARDLVRRQPGSAEAWHQLASALETQYRFDEALAAAKTGASLRTGNQGDAVFPAVIELRAGRLRDAEQRLRRLLLDSTLAIRNEARWNLVIALREQGRLAEALDEARRYRRSVEPNAARVENAILEAQVRFELGPAWNAAALFDSISRASLRATTPARQARNRTWHLTHVASALAAAGDTARLPALADSIERAGQESGYGRDHLLHHHARGLLLVARGRPAEAAEEFRRANFSWTAGFCRNNLELSQMLQLLGRAPEAVAVLQNALHGPVEAGGLYCTFTELHAALGRAFETAGQRDSAAANYRWAVDAWSQADPAFRHRRLALESQLTRLSRPR